MDRTKGLPVLLALLGACAGNGDMGDALGDDAGADEGSDEGARLRVWSCWCETPAVPFVQPEPGFMETESCGEPEPDPACECEETREPCYEGEPLTVQDAGAPDSALIDAAREPEPLPDAQVTPDAGADEALPVPIYTQRCLGTLDEIALEYRATVYNTDITLTECWETVGNTSLFAKYVLEPGDDGADTRACWLTGEHSWAFGTWAVRGEIRASADDGTNLVRLACTEAGAAFDSH